MADLSPCQGLSSLTTQAPGHQHRMLTTGPHTQHTRQHNRRLQRTVHRTCVCTCVHVHVCALCMHSSVCRTQRISLCLLPQFTPFAFCSPHSRGHQEAGVGSAAAPLRNPTCAAGMPEGLLVAMAAPASRHQRPDGGSTLGPGELPTGPLATFQAPLHDPCDQGPAKHPRKQREAVRQGTHVPSKRDNENLVFKPAAGSLLGRSHKNAVATWRESRRSPIVPVASGGSWIGPELLRACVPTCPVTPSSLSQEAAAPGKWKIGFS